MSTYLVKSGDYAGKIAKQYGLSIKQLQDLNPQYPKFVANADYIQAGWTLNVSTPAPTPTPAPAPAPAPTQQQKVSPLTVTTSPTGQIVPITPAKPVVTISPTTGQVVTAPAPVTTVSPLTVTTSPSGQIVPITPTTKPLGQISPTGQFVSTPTAQIQQQITDTTATIAAIKAEQARRQAITDTQAREKEDKDALITKLVQEGTDETKAKKIVDEMKLPTPNGDTGIPPLADKPLTDEKVYDVDKLGDTKLLKDIPGLLGAGEGTIAGDIKIPAALAGIIAMQVVKTPETEEYEKMFASYNAAVASLSDKGTDLATSLAIQKVPEKQAQIEELRLSIARSIAEAQTGLNKIADQPIPQGLLVGQSAAYQRQVTAKLTADTALLQAYSDNFSTAVSLAKDAVDYKWDGIKIKLTAIQNQVAFAKDLMDSADKKQLNVINILLKEQLRQVDASKDFDTEMNKLIIPAAKNGAGLDLIKKAIASGSLVAAADILKKYLAEKAKVLTYTEERTLRQDYEKDSSNFLQRQDAYFDMQKLLKKDARGAILAGTSAEQAAIAFNFFKIIDPTITTRPQQLDAIANFPGIWTELGNKLRNLLSNQKAMSAGEVQDLINTSEQLYGQATTSQKVVQDKYTKLAEEYGVDVARIIQPIREKSQKEGALTPKPGWTLNPDTGKYFKTPTTPTKEGQTTMTAPDGKKWNVPNEYIDIFKQNGYK